VLKEFRKEVEKTMYDELTKNDIKKMEEEIEYRKLVVRKEAIEAVKEARAQGDLSENFEYYAAKKDKNKNESRIRYLERMIRTAKVVSDESKDDEVGLYNTVDVYFEDDDETETYKIVTTIRGNSLKGLISSESPLGRALLGHKVGDRVHVQVNDRAGYDVIIKRLEKTVDDGSDAIRSF
jgi:transcription elongation factor GreA